MKRLRKLTLNDSEKQVAIKVLSPLARIDGISQFELGKILTFVMPNFWFSPKYQNKIWDGKIRFAKGKWFPVGFVNRVAKALDAPYHIEKFSKIQDKCDWEALNEFLERAEIKNSKERDYQENAIRTGIAEEIGIIGLAANAGKGRIIAGIVATLPQTNFLILANRIDILSEIKEVFQEFLLDAENYTLSTFQSAKKLDLEVYDGVLVDEAHVVAAKTFYKLLSKCVNASIRLGFTATADRPDGLGFYIEAVLGETICTISQKELIKRGISTKPKVFFVPFKIPFIENENYPDAENMLVNCAERNQLIADLVKDRKEVLILFKRKEHGKILENLIEGSVRIDGDTPAATRKTIKQNFKLKKIRVLLASSIFDAGINLPNILTLVLAWGGKSPIALTQRIGRALRKAEGKHSVDIFVPYEVGNTYFREHSKRRVEQFFEMGFEVEVMK